MSHAQTRGDMGLPVTHTKSGRAKKWCMVEVSHQILELTTPLASHVEHFFELQCHFLGTKRIAERCNMWSQ